MKTKFKAKNTMISNTMTRKIKQISYLAVYLLSGLLLITTSCKPKAEASAEAVIEAKTPVTITNVKTESMADVIELNAHSSFLKKNSVKANVSGHIESIELNPG